MFKIDDDMTINVTRGDCGTIDVSATVDGAVYVFLPGDILRLKVFEKKNCENVVLKKDFGIDVNATTVTLTLTGKDTKIGGMINKPTNYWYEIELNPETNPQTIVGYDDEGPKLFCLHPEGNEVEETEPEEADVGAFDDKLDLTSNKALPNWLITKEILALKGKVKQNETGNISVTAFGEVGKGDDRETIEKAIAALTDNSTLVFPKGHYVINSVPADFVGGGELTKHTLFKITNKKNVTIDLCNSIIEFAINKFNKQRCAIFRFEDCENFTIKNGTLIGDRLNHDYTQHITNEWGMGIVASTEKYPSGATPQNPAEPSSKKCGGKIENMEIYDFTGDGICINNGTSPADVKIDNCHIHHCRRQGITLGDTADVIIDRCYIHHIGTHDEKMGASPQAGIDIEPQIGTFSNGCIDIRNTIIEDTTGRCIVCSPKKVQDESGNTIPSSIAKKITIDNCNMSGVCTLAGRLNRIWEGEGVKYTTLTVKDSTFTHGLFREPNATKTENVVLYQGNKFCDGKITNCVFNSCNEDIYPVLSEHHDNVYKTLISGALGDTLTIDNCVFNILFPNARIDSAKITNSIINGGCLVSMEAPIGVTKLKECTGVVFNGCSFIVRNAQKKFPFVFCRFNDCNLAEADTGTLALRNCYFDTRLFKNADYRNCVIEDEIEV